MADITEEITRLTAFLSTIDLARLELVGGKRAVKVTVNGEPAGTYYPP